MSRLLSLAEAKEALLAGGLVGVPTETVYGLAANALNEKAVSRIFAVKKRPRFNPMICHLSTSKELPKYAKVEAAHRPLFSFWPGPLTLLLEHQGKIPNTLCAGLEQAGFRVPAHPLFRELIQICKVPLAAPSANFAGQRSPTTAAMVLEDLGTLINGVLDGGPCQIGLESTVVRLKKEKQRELEVLRPGGLNCEELRKAGFTVTFAKQEQNKPLAPGSLSQHYAPARPLVLILAERWQKTEILNAALAKYGTSLKSSCYLALGTEEIASQFGHCLNFSSSASLEEAAHNFFYFLDQAAKVPDIKLLVAHLFPEEGLGRALNDRLKRAASLHIGSKP